MMYGQMTAGSWIYIGSQGIVQGTYETFAELGKQHFGESLKQTITVTAGSPEEWVVHNRLLLQWQKEFVLQSKLMKQELTAALKLAT